MAGSLSIDVFNNGYQPIPGGPGWDDSIPSTWPASTSTLISGDHDAVLVDALLTTSGGQRLAAWVQNTGKRLRVIFVTHGHADHFFGAGPVLDAFPGAALVACDQQIVDDARGQTTPNTIASWNSRFAGQFSQSPRGARPGRFAGVRPGRPSPPVSHDRRRRRRARHDRAGAGPAGHLLRRHRLQQHPHVAVELHAGVTAGVAGVPGRGGRPQPVHDHHRHKDPGAPDDNATRVLDQSRRYIEDFGQTLAASSTPREVIDEMLTMYPAYGNRYTLFAAASAQFPS